MGAETVLLPGFDGIYRVEVEGRTVYTNGGRCSALPSNAEVMTELRRVSGTK